MFIHPSKTSQVQGLNESTLAALQWNKTSAKILAKYFNSSNVFSINLVIELSENTSINKYTIKLIERKQPSYRPIYTFCLVELETLKAYIKTHLKTRFIQLSKTPAGAPILFNKKPDGSFYLYIDYLGLNNLIIKN